MLRIYPISIEVTRKLAPVAKRIARFDCDHARQLWRSMKSVVFNLAEGAGSRAGRRRNAYDIALGEARETLANLQVAEALGYVPRLDDKVLALLHQIIGTLVKILH
jgi:four helix bundle protein